jgi:hypothetical protein
MHVLKNKYVQEVAKNVRTKKKNLKIKQWFDGYYNSILQFRDLL